MVSISRRYYNIFKDTARSMKQTCFITIAVPNPYFYDYLALEQRAPAARCAGDDETKLLRTRAMKLSGVLRQLRDTRHEHQNVSPGPVSAIFSAVDFYDFRPRAVKVSLPIPMRIREWHNAAVRLRLVHATSLITDELKKQTYCVHNECAYRGKKNIEYVGVVECDHTRGFNLSTRSSVLKINKILTARIKTPGPLREPWTLTLLWQPCRASVPNSFPDNWLSDHELSWRCPSAKIHRVKLRKSEAVELVCTSTRSITE